jgi:hypothetical protein
MMPTLEQACVTLELAHELLLRRNSTRRFLNELRGVIDWMKDNQPEVDCKHGRRLYGHCRTCARARRRKEPQLTPGQQAWAVKENVALLEMLKRCYAGDDCTEEMGDLLAVIKGKPKEEGR